jgi:hypothetical protein
MPNMSKPFGMVRTKPLVYLKNTHQLNLRSQSVLRLGNVSREDDVIIVGMSKKERVVALRKACKNIVNNARIQVIFRKSNGQKPFFVTCDSLGKHNIVNLTFHDLVMEIVQNLFNHNWYISHINIMY